MRTAPRHIDDVTAEIQPHLLPDDQIEVRDTGDGLGTLHVTLNHWQSSSAAWFHNRPGWTYQGPAMVALHEGEEPPVMNWIELSTPVQLN